MHPSASALTAASLLITLGACHGEHSSFSFAPPGESPAAALADLGVQVFPQYPALSPDGSTLVFSWAGDLWALRLDWSGAAPQVRASARLTAHPADERRAAFSPDGKLLAFDSTRDGARNLYVMPIAPPPGDEPGLFATGTPRRVTFADSAQTLGGFTSDGTALLFSAAQEPSIYRQSRMYRAPIDGGPVRRVTDAYGFLPRMSPDGGSILFARGYSSAIDRPVYRGSGNLELHSFSPATGNFTRITTAPTNDVDAYPTADGSIVFLSSRDGQYNVFRMPKGGTDADAKPVQLTHFSVPKDQVTIGHGVRDLAVSGDGKHAAFVVWDTLYTLDLTRADATPTALPIPLTADTASLDTLRMNLDKSVSEASLSPDGKTLAVVARGEVFVRSTEEGRPTRRVTATAGRERDLAWSPDGKVLYFASDQTGAYALYTATVSLSRDELEPKPARDALAEEKAAAAPAAAPSSNPGDAPKTEPSANAEKPAEASAEKPKSDKETKVDHGKRWADSLLFEVKPLLDPDGTDRLAPVPSPDGKQLLFTRGRGDLVMLDLEKMTQRVIFEGWDQVEVQWASDSRHIVYAVSDLDYNSDIWLLDTQAEGAAPINLTQHPDNDVSPRLSQDGKVLVFLSERAGQNDEFDVWQVYLDKRLEGLKAYELDEYYKKAAEAGGKLKPLGAPAGEKKPEAKGDTKPEAEAPKKEPAPLTFDTDDAYLRVQRVTTTGASGLAITPGADRILFNSGSGGGGGPEGATAGGDRSFVSVDRKGEDRKVIQAGNVSDPRVSLTGDKVTFVRAGSVSVAPPKGGKVDVLPIDAPVVIDVAAQQRQKFLEAARILGTRFYHPTLKGLNWDALTTRYLGLATRTRTSEEFDRVVQLLFGELNGSHTGITSPPAYNAPRPGVGILGASLEPVADGYRVVSVVANSPADQRTSKLNAGDVILGVDATRFASLPALPDISQLLLGRAGKETLLEVRRADGATVHLIIVPTSAAEMTNIGYVDEVLRRRAMVEKLSGGRLGYLHIRAMGDASVRDFERDLYAAAHGKDGLVIDVRDNGGGYTTDILLSSLTAPAHARTYPRGVSPENVPQYAYPRDRRLIYAYARPINVLINENSFSNAEVFAHAIQNTKRGTLVGTPTFGGVISTGAATLLDGTSVRVPGRGWILPNGKDMENNGAEPEVSVAQTPADEAGGRDPQLEAAVTELLQRIGPAGAK